MKPQIIQQGAEAILIRKENLVLKRRVKKGYRINEIDDKLRKQRTRKEAKLLEKAGKIIDIPKVLKVDEKNGEIDMEFIEGKKLSESLDELENWKEACFEIGRNIAKLHDADIIHGDLTTSNMILAEDEKLGSEKDGEEKLSHKSRSELLGVSVDGEKDVDKVEENADGIKEKRLKVYFIDFGLGFGNGRIEDKAVDLHLIKLALEAKHFANWEKYFEMVLEGYRESENCGKVLEQFKKVERGGRYKQQY